MLSANKQSDLHSLLVVAASNGVVIATEKKLPSILVDENSVHKIQLITPNIGVAYRSTSGLRILVKLHPQGSSLLTS
jgi:20S proteasome alpha/beta subunit